MQAFFKQIKRGIFIIIQSFWWCILSLTKTTDAIRTKNDHEIVEAL